MKTRSLSNLLNKQKKTVNNIINPSNKKPYGFKSFIDEVNYLIVKNLKFSKNPIKKLKVYVNKSVRNFLLTKYRLDYSFKTLSNFLNENGLISERFFVTNNNKCNKMLVDNESFQMKLNKQSSVKYFNKNLVSNKLKDKQSISIRFIRESNTEFTEIQKNVLELRKKSLLKKLNL